MKILYFSWLKEKVGKEEESITLPKEDDTVEKLGGDREVSSRVDDDGKLHLMVHDVVLSNPEETGDEQHFYMTVEQVT